MARPAQLRVLCLPDTAHYSLPSKKCSNFSLWLPLNGPPPGWGIEASISEAHMLNRVLVYKDMYLAAARPFWLVRRMHVRLHAWHNNLLASRIMSRI